MLLGGIFATGIYGGYFGAAQGILLFGILASSLDQDLREVNAVRAVLAGLANAVAAVIFIFAAEVAWLAGPADRDRLDRGRALRRQDRPRAQRHGAARGRRRRRAGGDRPVGPLSVVRRAQLGNRSAYPNQEGIDG